MADIQFLLLELPSKAQKNVLQTMDYGQLIGFSLCSGSTKRLVISLKYTAHRLYLDCTTDWELHMSFFSVLFAKPHGVRVFEGSRRGNPQNYKQLGVYHEETFGVGNWISHLACIFNRGIISTVSVSESTTVEEVEDAIGSTTFYNLHIDCPNQEHTENLLKKLVPRDEVEKLKGSFQCGSRVLFQNLKILTVFDCRSWKLDDFLILNAKCVYLLYASMTSKDCNRFLKLWMKGSNPHLIYFEYPIGRGFDRNELKKGIKGTEISADTTRKFTRWMGPRSVEGEEVRGGFDIRRNDGTLATILFEGRHSFNFIVWQ